MTLPVLLVTGASGFIGRALLDQISQGLTGRYRSVLLASHPIDGWLTLDDRRDATGLYGFCADSFREVGIGSVEAVIHLGAFTPKSAAQANDVRGSLANIVNTRHLIENLPSAPSRLVFASSLDVYAPAPGPLSEEHCCDPLSLYGQSKLFCERLLMALASPTTLLQILRIGHTYGAGEEAYRKFIPETIRRLLGGNPPRLTTTGDERRAFVHVEDCCRMILAALDLDASAGPINIASRDARSLIDIANMLCAIGRDFGGPSLEPAVARGAQPGRDVVPDASKMEILLGKEKVSLVEGLRQEFAHMSSLAQ